MQLDNPNGNLLLGDLVACWISRVSRVLQKVGDSQLRPHGFAISYVPVLRALENGAALPLTELARIAGVEQPTMTETLARMERDGIVERKPNPSDKRSTLIVVSRRARAKYPKVSASLRAAEDELMSVLSLSEKRQIVELLIRIATHAETVEAVPLPRAPAARTPATSARPRRASRSKAPTVTPKRAATPRPKK